MILLDMKYKDKEWVMRAKRSKSEKRRKKLCTVQTEEDKQVRLSRAILEFQVKVFLKFQLDSKYSTVLEPKDLMSQKKVQCHGIRDPDV